jgi:hypothetical protein
MTKAGQRFVVKFLFLKVLDSEEIHKELIAILEDGDLSGEDTFRPGHHPHILEKAVSDFLKEFLFGIAGVIAQHFNQSKPTVKKILQRELGLQRFS